MSNQNINVGQGMFGVSSGESLLDINGNTNSPNNMLAFAINDLRSKLQDMKEASVTQNEMQLKTL